MNEWKTESTWQSLARMLVAGTVVGGGTLLLFGNDPREAFANGFDHPPGLFPWIADAAEADRFIAAGGRRQRVPAAAAQPALC